VGVQKWKSQAGRDQEEWEDTHEGNRLLLLIAFKIHQRSRYEMEKWKE
jgi:hypothetical protein